MTKTTDIKKVKEILRLKFGSHLSHRDVAKSLNVGSSTVSDIVVRFNNALLIWPLPDILSDDELTNMLYPVKNAKRVVPDYGKMDIELRHKGMTKLLLWEEYQRSNPHHCYGYSQYCENYTHWKSQQKRSMRQTHKAGEKIFIDYCGPTMPIVNPDTGECRRVQVFVAVLGASNYTFAIATESQKSESWLNAHSRMFEFFGGVAELLVPDNLKAGVIKADRFEPTLNTSYQALASHYGCAVMPARPRKPKDKAKAENSVLIVERWIMARLRHQVFHTLAALNQQIKILLDDLNQRPFQRLPGCRKELFEQLDKPVLKPLPATPYEYTDIHRAKVGIDYHVLYREHFYSVPHVHVGHQVYVHATQRLVRIYYQNECIAQHVKSTRKGGFTCCDEHMPLNHQHQKWSPGRLKNWALQIGDSTLKVVTAILEKKPHPELGYRACLGLLNLARQYGDTRLEQACHKAIEIKNPCRASVASILKSRLENTPAQGDEDTPNISHQNIRGSDYYK